MQLFYRPLTEPLRHKENINVVSKWPARTHSIEAQRKAVDMVDISELSLLLYLWGLNPDGRKESVNAG